VRSSLKIKLKASGWDRVLNEFIDGKDFDTLMTALFKCSNEGGMTPAIGNVFRPFYECPYNDLKVVLLEENPYPDEGIADGLALSCSKSKAGEMEPALNVIFDEIQETVYAKQGEDWYANEPDLTRWAKQGVLLLNINLTTEPGKIATHNDIWKPFTDYLFAKLIDMNVGLIYIFLGDVAKEQAKKIPEINYKFRCYHPNAAFYDDRRWESNDVFNRINEILGGSNGTNIIW
jgi:uracil-DNA glycosylase